MNIFIIHRGKDLDKAIDFVNKYDKKEFNLHFLILKNNPKFWKHKAKKLIAKADKVIYLSGEEFSENIEWEINIAKKLNIPLYIVPISKEYSSKSFLFIQDEYKKEEIAPIVLDEDVNKILIDVNEELNNKLFNTSEPDNSILWEQYKLMLQTSENLVERRQKITATYLAILSILTPAITAMITFNNKLINLCSVVVSFLAIILCISWRGMIISYGKSNQAKFEILELIESKLPANLFGSEWTALKFHVKNYKSFTNRETMMPMIFIIINIVLIAIAIIVFILKYFAKI